MARRRVLIATANRWAHIDFGGRGVLRLARGLLARGLEVHWLLASGNKAEFAERLPLAISGTGAQVLADPAEPWVFTPGSPESGVASSVERLVRLLQDGGYGALILDRALVHASRAAELAGLPFAAVGTNGAGWTLIPGAEAPFVWPSGEPAGPNPTRAPSPRTDWVISPFLNLSFFPAQFWPHRQGPAHFLGTGAASATVQEPHRNVVVVGGTGWHPTAHAAVLQAVSLLQQQLGGAESVQILPGEGPEDGREPLRESESQALASADVCIVHAGIASVWQAFRRGAQVLTVCPWRGDQLYNSERILELGLGSSLSLQQLSPLAIAQEALRLHLDKAALARARAFAARCASGGGVDAGVTLIQRLLESAAPVNACVEGACCC